PHVLGASPLVDVALARVGEELVVRRLGHRHERACRRLHLRLAFGPRHERRAYSGSRASFPCEDEGMSSGTRRSTAALRHRDFAIFWWSSLVSNSGSWLQNVAVPFALFKLTHSPAWVGF